MVLHTSGVREGHPDYERQISSSLWRSETEKQQAGIRERFCGPCSVNAWQSGATVHNQAFSRASSLSRESIFFEMTRGTSTRRCLICIKGCARAYELRARMRDLLNSTQAVVYREPTGKSVDFVFVDHEDKVRTGHGSYIGEEMSPLTMPQ